MTQLDTDARTLTVTFPGWERLMTRRASYSVPLGAIDTVEVIDDWTSEVLGMRSGLVVSGMRKLGTFRHPNGTRRLVSMKRGLPLLRIRFRSRGLGAGYDELLISAPNAAEVASLVPTGGPA